MDPLSISASIAGLITLADVVIDRTYKTIITCKNAGKDAERLLQETSTLLGILKSLDNLSQHVSSSQLKSQIPAEQIRSCQKTLEEIRSKLETATPTGQNVLEKIKRTLIWPITKADTEKYIQSMERYKVTFGLCISVDTLNNIIDSSSAQDQIREDVTDIRQNLADLYRITMDDERSKILDYFSTFDSENAYYSNVRMRQSGTGLWLLQISEFETWLNTRGSKLWCFGIPGAGKSVLAALAIQETLKSASSSYAVAYYHCDYKRQESQQLVRILACIAGQLARQHERCFNALKEAYPSKRDGMLKHVFPDESELTQLVAKMIRSFDDVALIVDGIDECSNPASVSMAFSNLTLKLTSLRVLLFSRDEPTIRPYLDGFESTPIAARTSDLVLYVAARIEEMTKRGELQIQNTSLKDEIIDKLVNGADGMFRWVSCQLDHLGKLYTDKARRQALQSLPPNLNATYERILQKVNDQGVEAQTLVQRVLHWSFAKLDEYIYLPLSAEDLCVMVSINEDDTKLDPEAKPNISQIVACCSSLLRLSSETGRLEPAHFTVEEFLGGINPETHPSLARYMISRARTNSYIRRTVLTYLTLTDFALGCAPDSKTFDDRNQAHHLYSDMARLWPAHCWEENEKQTFRSQIPRLFHREYVDNFRFWAQTCVLNHARVFNLQDHDIRRAATVATSSNPLHFAAMFHMADLLTPLVEYGYNVDSGSALGSPLQCAILQSGAAENAMHRIGWMYRLIPVYNAQRCCDTIATLIQSRANLRLPMFIYGLSSDYQRRSVLWLAYLKGCATDVLRAGARFDAETVLHLKEDLAKQGSANGWLALKDYSEDSFEQPALQKLTDLLLERTMAAEAAERERAAAESSATKASQRESLEFALKYEDELVMPWLTKGLGLDITNFRYDNGDTLLHATTKYGRHTLVRWLLKNGVNANAKNKNGETALHTWIDMMCQERELPNHLHEIVGILLDSGADPSFGDRGDPNFLHICAGRNPELVTRYMAPMYRESPTHWYDRLLEQLRGAAEQFDRQNLRPWIYALNRLKSEGEDVDAKTFRSYADAIEILIRECIKPASSEEEKSCPLHTLCAHVNFSMVEGTRIWNHTYDYFTPVLQSVLHIVPGIDMKDDQGLCPIDILLQRLEVASTAGLAELIKRWPCEKPIEKEPWAVPALCLAILSDDQNLGCMLAERGVDVDAKCEHLNGFKKRVQGLSAVEVVCLEGRSAILARSCFRRSRQLNEYHVDGYTLLQILIISERQNKHEILAELASAGIDLDRPCRQSKLEGITALMFAATLGDSKACEILLSNHADVTCSSTNRTTALLCACSSPVPDPRIVELLLRLGANSCDETEDGQTALLLMCNSRSSIGSRLPELAKLLLDYNAKVSTYDLPGLVLLQHRYPDNNWLTHYEKFGLKYQAIYGQRLFPHGPLQLSAREGEVELYTILKSDIRRRPGDWGKIASDSMLEPLWIACAYGNVALSKHLIAEGMNLEYKDPVQGLHCIHAAVLGSQHAIIRLLFESACDMESKDGSDRSPLALAIYLKDSVTAKLLESYLLARRSRVGLQAQPPTNAPSDWNPTLRIAMEAIQQGDLEGVRAVFETGYPLGGKLPCNSCTPFLWSLASGKPDIAEFLLRQGVSVDGQICQFHRPRGYTALHLASALSGLHVVLWKLLQRFSYGEVTKHAIQPLHIAAAHNNGTAAQLLANSFSTSSMLFANAKIRTRELGFQWTFVNGVACPALHSGTPLHVAVSLGHFDVVHALFANYKVEADARNHTLRTPLHLAVSSNNEFLARYLIDRKADINACDMHNVTPVAIAAFYGLTRMLELLQGTNIAIRDTSGRSPMTAACWQGQLAVVRGFLSRGIQLGEDHYGNSDLMLLLRSRIPWSTTYALSLRVHHHFNDILWGWPDNHARTLRRVIRALSKEQIERCLAQKHANTKSTPLYYAAMQDQTAVIDVLIQTGADIDAAGGPLGSPLMAACSNERLAAVRLLVRRGASLLYSENGHNFSAVDQASSSPLIVRWLIFERFVDQKKLTL